MNEKNNTKKSKRLVATPVYLMLLAKAPMHGPIFIAAILPCMFLLFQGNI